MKPALDLTFIPPGSRVLVAYSGGADSTCLLVLLHEAGVDLVAAHLHHGQRTEADTEADRCAAFCEQLGVPFVLGRADVPGLAKAERIGLEEAGRRARYSFLRSAAQQTGCSRIATGHTRDDLAETVLFNLVRGTGLPGLAGIRPEARGIVRPLLSISRDQTREFCRSRALWFHDDPANDDLRYSRARLRHRVLPELRRVHDAADEAISRAAAIVRMESDYLDAIAAAALEACELPLDGPLRFLTSDSEVALDRSRFDLLHEVVARRGLRLAVGALGGSLDHRAVEGIVEGLRGDDKGAVTAEGGRVVVEWNPSRILIRSLAEEPAFRLPLIVPGTTSDPILGWSIVAEAPGTQKGVEGALSVVIDPRGVKGPLYCRPAAPGDRIETVGMPQPKRVASLLADLKLSSRAKKRLPIVCDLLGPIWVPGSRVARRVTMEKGSDRGLCLSLCPNPPQNT